MPEHFDVAVLGGGSGLTAAWFADQDGRSVALIDEKPDALGGTCVNRGCIPTKGLIQSAEVMKTIHEAHKFGIDVPLDQVKVDVDKVFDIVLERRSQGAEGVKGWVDDAFTPFYGRARFVGPKELEMEDGTRITADAFFITTGASPMVPPVPGLDEVAFWTNREAIESREIPESLIILGGGYIGCEFGHFFATLGSDVTVIEMSDVLGPEDDDVKEVFRGAFGKKVNLLEGHKATEVGKDGDDIVVTAEDKDGATSEHRGKRILVAAGRVPNTGGMGLEEAGIETDDRGWIQVDEHLRTTAEGVYAYGDVIGQGMFKHTSSYEGELAYRNSQGAELDVSYRSNPHAVFSDPQVAGVGLTEREAREQGLEIEVAKSDYTGAMKGEIIGSPPGLCKLIVEKGSKRILGFHMVGPGAADLIHEVVVAMNAGDGTADLVQDTIHVHPTMPELVKAVFDQV